MKLPISVIVLTYNEEKNIADCLESVQNWADEIIVVDSYSDDKTLEIAGKYTDKIYQHPFENYSQQRNWAQDNLPIKNEWVFHLDADERVTLELSTELKEVFSNDYVDEDGFLISRRTVFMGRWIKHGGHYPAYHLRLFRHKKGRCEDRVYDQHFILEGKAGFLRGDIIDVITSDFKEWISRLNRWSTAEAQEAGLCERKFQVKARFTGTPIERKRWLRNIYYRMPMFARAFAYFFYRYVIRLGFLDGLEGLIFHFIQGCWYRFLVDVKIYEIKKTMEDVGGGCRC